MAIAVLRRHVALVAHGIAKTYQLHIHVHDKTRIFDPHELAAFSLPTPELYPALMSKVGLLAPGLTHQIVMFYAAYQEVKARLPLLAHDPARPFSYGATFVLKPALVAVAEITDTLFAIEKMGKFYAVAEQPDTGEARIVLGLIEAGVEKALAAGEAI
jgi:hypothetical protein